MAAPTGYRKTTLGVCLSDTLDEVKMQCQQLPDHIVNKVLEQFDRSMSDALVTRVKTTANFKAEASSYNFYDDVWQINVANMNVKIDGQMITFKNTRFIATDAKICRPSK